MPDLASVLSIAEMLRNEPLVDDALEALDHSRQIEIEVFNGMVYNNTNDIKTEGLGYVRCLANYFKKGDHTYYDVFEHVDGTSTSYKPPASNLKFPSGDGFRIALFSRTARGCFFCLPVQGSRLWVDAVTHEKRDANKFWKELDSTTDLELQNALAKVKAKGFRYPGYYHPTWIIVGALSHGGSFYLAPLSYLLANKAYEPSSTYKDQAIEAWTASLFKGMYANYTIGLAANVNSSELVSTPETPTVYIGDVAGLGASPMAYGYKGYADKSGKSFFLDDDGNHCNPFLNLHTELISKNSSDIKIRLDISKKY